MSVKKDNDVTLLESTDPQGGPLRESPRARAEPVDAGQPGQAFYRLRATTTLDASVTARILQCFVRNGQIPDLFLATRSEGEIRVEAWLPKTSIALSAMGRIASSVEAIVTVVSVSLESGDDSRLDASEAKNLAS